VGIWAGNATGEGRPTLTGVTSAAPILFDVFNLLPRQRWFGIPYEDLNEVEVCSLSGYLAKEGCPKIKQWVTKKGKSTRGCPYHKTIHLDKTQQFQVNSSCESVENIVTKNWFVLPPVMAWYYKGKHIEYLPLPPFKEDCLGTQTISMDFIYPKTNSKIYLTKNFNSEIQPVIFKVAYSQREKQLFWYVDHVYKGVTKVFHEKPIIMNAGFHYITVVDESGNEITRKVEIIRE
jgi:penicillin-binding protein 1C